MIRATPRSASESYIWWSAAVTAFLYSTGYAAIGFGLLFLGAIWRLLRWRSFLWRPTPLDPPLTVFGAVLMVSAIVSPYRSIALTITPMLLLSGAVYYGSFAWLLDRAPGARMALLRVWALGAVPAALAGLAVMRVMNAHAGPEDYTRALIPHGVGPNGLGTTLLLGSLLALGLGVAADARVWERGFWLLCSAVALVGLAATESRASVLGWIAGVGCLLGYVGWAALRPRARAVAAVVAAVIVGLVVTAIVIPQASDLTEGPVVSLAKKVDPTLVNRMINTVNDLAANRFKIWYTSLRMVAASPWLGTGFGTFETAYAHWRSPEMSREPFAFNLALDLAVETGLLGLYATMWVAEAGIVQWRRWGRSLVAGADPSRPIVATLWVGLLVNQLADNTLFSISTSAAFWFLLALLVVPGGRSSDRAADDRAHPDVAPKETPVLL